MTRSVFLTGHTGFKGGWMAHYLESLGVNVHGYGRSRSAREAFYELAHVRRVLASETIGDLRDLPTLKRAMQHARPSVVYHMAARAIVRESIEDPVGVVETNVLGSTHVLEAARRMDPSPAVVLVTTDKVYRNAGGVRAFVESDELGGLCPYGASKAAVELVADAYRHTYGLRVATARCANVVGGGDWGRGRLVPNALRAAEEKGTVTVHEASRVFVHVLDALAGYVALGERLAGGDDVAGAWNFGPEQAHSVRHVAEAVVALAGAGSVERSGHPPDREAHDLAIDSSRAALELGWRPRWDLDEALRRTVLWHRAHRNGADMDLVTRCQIDEFLHD